MSYLLSTECNVYIDESGDLGKGCGTRWFVLTAVIVTPEQEEEILETVANIKHRLNIDEIHFKNIKPFERKAYIIQELTNCDFTLINILVDTNKLTLKPNDSNSKATLLIYNYVCKYLLERISSWLLENDATGNIILSSRSSLRDKELISYINDKLLPYSYNDVCEFVINSVSSAPACTLDMLQVADACAYSVHKAHEENEYGMVTPYLCRALVSHFYSKEDKIIDLGLKYFTSYMQPKKSYFAQRTLKAK